jgi:hypothetical protein
MGSCVRCSWDICKNVYEGFGANFFNYQINAVFLAEPVSDTIAAMTTGVLFLYQNKKIFKRQQVYFKHSVE